MTKVEDHLNDAVIGDGITICGLPPKKSLTTLTDWECFNCHAKQVVRKFSGSGWYEDDSICAACGDNNTTYYRPFRRGWRKENLATAAKWLAEAIPAEEYRALTMAAIKREMGWDDPLEHDFRTFDERDVCDLCEQPENAHGLCECEFFTGERDGMCKECGRPISSHSGRDDA